MPGRQRGLGAGAATALRRPAARDSSPPQPAGDSTESPGPAPGENTPPRQPRGGIVAALQRHGAASAEARGAQVVPLAEVVEHPQNPRDDLGDLTGLTDSIREFGVLQPIVVVPADAFLDAHPQHRDAVGERAWVVIAGHRRRVAAEAAGHDTIPAMVRPDLAGAGLAAVAFVVENVHREDLAPLEEARAYALLADLGIGQRDIARRTGVSQSHVSKRLVLLRLPQPVQDDLTTGGVSIGDALALTGVPAEDQAEAYQLAKANRWPIPTAVAAVTRQREEQKVAAAARAQAEDEGVALVDPTQRWGTRAYRHQLHRDAEVAKARKSGTLVAAATPAGLAYYSTEAATAEPRTGDGDPDANRRTAMKARAAACARLVATRPAPEQVVTDLARLVVHGRLAYADCLRLCHAWLGERLGPRSSDMHEWARGLADDPDATRWVAWAMSVAADETHARSPHSPWGPRQADHVQRLADHAGYSPTAWETQRMRNARTSTPGRPPVDALVDDDPEGTDA